MQHGNRGRGMPWAVSVPRSSFPDRQPDHYVFPFEHCGAKGEEDLFGFTGGGDFLRHGSRSRALRETAEVLGRSEIPMVYPKKSPKSAEVGNVAVQ